MKDSVHIYYSNYSTLIYNMTSSWQVGIYIYAHSKHPFKRNFALKYHILSQMFKPYEKWHDGTAGVYTFISFLFKS